jgi:TonB family protein
MAVIVLFLAAVTNADDSSKSKSDKSFEDLASNAKKADRLAQHFIVVDSQPVLIDMPAPVYPEKAHKLGVEAKLYVNALVDSEGKVIEAEIIRIPDDAKNLGFEDAALDAACQARYKPAIKDDKAVEVWISYPVHFKLQNSEDPE